MNDRLMILGSFLIIVSLCMGRVGRTANADSDHSQPAGQWFDRLTTLSNVEGRYLPLEVAGGGWQFKAEGPWVDLPDRRGLRGMRYPWHISTTGEFAEVSRQVTVPEDWRPPFILTFFCSDDYLDDGSRPEKTTNSVDAYPGHRFKQALVNGEVVWERDIADDSAPGAPTDFVVDISDRARRGEAFTLALRNFDKVGLDTRLETDFYLRGVYESGRPEGNEVLATTCWWGDVTLRQGGVSEPPKWLRPSNAAVEERHAIQWPYPPAGQAAKLPVVLHLEGAEAPLVQDTPVTCGVPLPQGLINDVSELSLWGPEGELCTQMEAMNTWPDGSLRWVRVNTVLPAGTAPAVGCRLMQGKARATPSPPMRTASIDGKMILRTGNLEILCGESPEYLIDHVEWAGRLTCYALRSEILQGAPDGTVRTLTARWEKWEITRQGPVRATVEATGTVADENGSLGPIICRIDAYADVPALRITHRIFNSGAERADLTMVRLVGELNLRESRQSACGLIEGGGTVPGPALRVAQTDADNFTLAAGGEASKKQGRCQGWLATGDGEVWLAATVRQFWQQFPTALECGERQISIEFFSPSEAMPAYGCRAGEAKRHEVWLNFGFGALDTDLIAAVTRSNQRPLRLFDPHYFCAAEGLGYAYPHDENFEPVAVHMAKAYPAAAYDTMALLFGIRDFGDSYYDANKRTYRNNYYDVLRGQFGEYLVSGDGNWFDRGEEAAHHYMDIDQFHDSLRSHDQHGANASTYTPNHNDEFGIWPAMLRPGGGMLTYWRLSGDEDARESALMLADYIVRTKAGKGQGSVRDNAGPLHTLAWAYDETRDPRYLQVALEIADSVKQFIVARRGCYAETHGAHNYRGNVPWMVAQLCEALYMLHRQSGEVWVADMLVGLVESIAGENMEPGNPGNFQGYTHDPVLHRGDWNSNYNVLIAPCFGLAYELTGDPYFLSVMRGAYDIAVSKNDFNDVRNCYWMTPMLLYLLEKHSAAE